MMSRDRRFAVGALMVLLAVQPPSAQQPTLPYATLALAPAAGARVAPPLACSTDLIREVRAGLRTAEPLPDGWPLWFDQNPRLLRGDYTGPVSLDNFMVVGDVASLTFERTDLDQESEVTVETWQRVGSTSIDGRVVSIFQPSWEAGVVQGLMRRVRHGVDRPVLPLGSVVAPDGAVVTADGRAAEARLDVWLNLAPVTLPSSTVRQIDSTVQYASHVVNLVIPTFGDGRVADGDGGFDLEGAAGKFYQHFADVYESLAFVTEAQQVAAFSAFHLNVRNPISGLGSELVSDESAAFGSDSILRSVELYPYNSFAENETSNHEIGHQWVDYWDWSAIAGGIELAGHNPTGHTPLIYPGAVLTGAVLEGSRRAREVDVQTADDSSTFTIERTPAPVLQNPTTRFRMGLLSAADVPEMRIFENQGQFTEDGSAATPATGTAVDGGHRAVTINDVMAQHGPRSGPVETVWRRATVVVSRDGLLSQTEMNYWNFFAARHAATEGITSWDGYGGFTEATEGQVPLTTAITPREDAPLTDGPTGVTFAPIDPGEFPGIQLDAAIPGRVAIGRLVTVAGLVTTTERADFNTACVRFYRYGAADLNEVFVCGAITGNRFSLPVSFTAAQVGQYTAELFLFWPGSGGIRPRSWVSVIVVG